ncbi:HAMP domain-containing sensor histidine kinase [Aliikangiella sp. G2MR2-5]|uniref:sensor histidine kinase n=1 Tax=Aliikangiella sp. G2MR2-5 TaxID=2788943 RepID=UPI0018AA996E|nr:HAMP domain-containing sensor histidine kinase [Aliikangiella sp. G2MR2-5]
MKKAAPSITRRLVTSLVVSVTIVFIVIAGLLFLAEKKRQQTNLNNQVETTLDYLTGSLSTLLWNVADDEIIAIGNTITQNTLVVRLEIIDIERSENIFSYHRNVDGNLFAGNRKIFYKDTLIGEINYAITDQETEQEILNSLKTQLFVLTFIIIFIILSMFYLVKFYFDRPFKKISKLIGSYSLGNYGLSLDSIKEREFLPLKSVLEKMGEKILAQIDTLRMLNTKLEARVEERTKMLEETIATAHNESRIKNDFLKSVGEAMENQVTIILNSFEKIIDKPLSHENHDILEITKKLEELQRLAKDIDSFCQLDFGELVVEKDEFNPREMVEAIARDFAPHCDKKSIEFITEFNNLDLSPVVGDQTKLRQVIDSLLRNAEKYTFSGNIVFDASFHGGYSNLEFHCKISDSGTGISSDFQEKLFDPYCRVDNSSATCQARTGLGLPICKKIIEIMGGDLKVESTPGLGTSLSFYCDVFKCDKTQTLIPEVSLNNEKIILIDSNQKSAQSICRQISVWGGEITAFQSLETLLNTFETSEQELDITLFMIGSTIGVNQLEKAITKIRGLELNNDLRVLLLVPTSQLRNTRHIFTMQEIQVISRPLFSKDFFEALRAFKN